MIGALPPGLRTAPPAAREVALAVTGAVGAAAAGDAAAFARAATAFAGLDPERVRLVLSGVLRPLLEDLHADGITGDDLRDAVAGCLRRAAGWAPEVDPQVLVVVLAGAFGIHPADHEERPDVAPPEVARHACLLVADLLTTSDRRLGPYLELSFTEIARAEHQDD